MPAEHDKGYGVGLNCSGKEREGHKCAQGREVDREYTRETRLVRLDTGTTLSWWDSATRVTDKEPADTPMFVAQNCAYIQAVGGTIRNKWGARGPQGPGLGKSLENAQLTFPGATTGRRKRTQPRYRWSFLPEDPPPPKTLQT